MYRYYFHQFYHKPLKKKKIYLISTFQKLYNWCNTKWTKTLITSNAIQTTTNVTWEACTHKFQDYTIFPRILLSSSENQANCCSLPACPKYNPSVVQLDAVRCQAALFSGLLSFLVIATIKRVPINSSFYSRILQTAIRYCSLDVLTN